MLPCHVCSRPFTRGAKVNSRALARRAAVQASHSAATLRVRPAASCGVEAVCLSSRGGHAAAGKSLGNAAACPRRWPLPSPLPSRTRGRLSRVRRSRSSEPRADRRGPAGAEEEACASEARVRRRRGEGRADRRGPAKVESAEAARAALRCPRQMRGRELHSRTRRLRLPREQ